MPGSTPQLSARTVRDFMPDTIDTLVIKRDFFANPVLEQIMPNLRGSFLNSTVFNASASCNFIPAAATLLNLNYNFTLPVVTPQASSNPFADVRNFDKSDKSDSSIIRLFHGREDMISENVSDIYKEV
jgi:hypothetical protein